MRGGQAHDTRAFEHQHSIAEMLHPCTSQLPANFSMSVLAAVKR